MSLLPTGRRRPAAWLFALIVAGACTAGADRILGPSLSPSARPSADAGTVTPPAVVISEIYGGGGNSGATFKNDFVELYNRGTTAVDLTNWTIQYASASGTGTFASNSPALLSGSLAPGQYYLVQLAGGATGAALPTSDATGTINMSGTAGKVALVNQAAGLACNGGSAPCTEQQRATIVDLVGYGSANFSEGPAAPSPTNNALAILRRDDGRQDTNNNAADFTVVTVKAPRNRQSPILPPLDNLVVTIAPATPTVQAGAPVTFTASATKSGQSVAINSATWSSSNSSVATIDPATGAATTLATGSTTIGVSVTTAEGTGTASTMLSVSGAPATVTVAPATATVKVNQTKALTASALDASGNAVSSTFTWASSNTTVATVDASGVVTGKALGTATITATSANGKSAGAEITVISASSLALTSGKSSLALGMQTQFFFSGSDASGNPITSVTWSTTDESVITVDGRGVVTGKALGSAQLRATAPDGSVGSVPMTVYLAAAATGPLRLGHNTEFGEPADADPSDDFLIRRAQYTVSYNPRRGGANWVSWNIDATHLGGSGRCSGTCYSADTALINAGITAYTTADWVSGNTYDRGHMAPSADWTSSEADNNTTFFLSNFLPQKHDMNAGPWERLENALRDSVTKGNREIYVIAGGVFTNGVGLGLMAPNNKIQIPDSTWKIAVLTPAGTGINADGSLPAGSNVIAVNMPNIAGIIGDPWEKYKITVAELEKSTGYDFLALLADATECRVEVRNCAPSARITGSGIGGGLEGQALHFDASTSSDPDVGDALHYQWSVDGTVVGSGATLDHVFADNGTYQVRLLVTDNGGATDVATASVNVANVAPSIGALAGGTVNEGSAFTGAGSFTDPGDDSWHATVDYGDGSGVQPLALAGTSFSLAHTYANDGSFTITVTVTETDAEGASGSRSATVTVSNVAPEVATFPGATILRGETYTSSGTFTDPGADVWAATVNYGDGAGPSDLPLTGNAFALQHTYNVAGVHSVTVTVSDADGGSGTRTAQVTVLSSGEAIAALAAKVSRLVALGSMEDGDAKWLANKLDVAAKELARGNDVAARNQLQQTIERIEAAQRAGRLSSTDADSLTAYATRILASMA